MKKKYESQNSIHIHGSMFYLQLYAVFYATIKIIHHPRNQLSSPNSFFCCNPSRVLYIMFAAVQADEMVIYHQMVVSIIPYLSIIFWSLQLFKVRIQYVCSLDTRITRNLPIFLQFDNKCVIYKYSWLLYLMLKTWDNSAFLFYVHATRSHSTWRIGNIFTRSKSN